MDFSKATQENSLRSYQSIIEAKILEMISTFGPQTRLREACEYALTNGGKRMRPAIALMVAKALGLGADVSFAALAIEYFHTASLVVDDLPCMDDDDERRSKPSVHKRFGEPLALLVSYALIAEGYGCLAKNTQSLKHSAVPHAVYGDAIGIMALENAAFNTGLQGATGGQFLDIAPPDLSWVTLKDIIHKKTVSLFEIAFVAGWLFGGGSPQQINLVKKAASHFGTAFQIADDIGDVDQDQKNERLVNVAAVFGVEAAQKLLKEEIEGYHASLKELNIFIPDLISLTQDML